jgi:nitroreductase
MKPDISDPRLAFIFGRRSIRRFEDTPVSDEDLHRLLLAAMAAPSAVARDPWRFVVVRDRKRKLRITEGLPNGKLLDGAPLAIVVCGERSAAQGGLEGYMVQDCTAALQNLLLAAHAMGLGTCWLGVYPRTERQEHVNASVGLPPEIEALAVVAVGHPGESKEARSRYREEYVHYESW